MNPSGHSGLERQGSFKFSFPLDPLDKTPNFLCHRRTSHTCLFLKLVTSMSDVSSDWLIAANDLSYCSYCSYFFEFSRRWRPLACVISFLLFKDVKTSMHCTIAWPFPFGQGKGIGNYLIPFPSLCNRHALDSFISKANDWSFDG